MTEEDPCPLLYGCRPLFLPLSAHGPCECSFLVTRKGRQRQRRVVVYCISSQSLRICFVCHPPMTLMPLHSLTNDRLTSAFPVSGFLLSSHQTIMITRFLTDVRVKFNPFSPRAKSARLFLSLIPPSARADGMKVDTQMLPRTSKEPPTLGLKFSTCDSAISYATTSLTEYRRRKRNEPRVGEDADNGHYGGGRQALTNVGAQGGIEWKLKDHAPGSMHFCMNIVFGWALKSRGVTVYTALG